MNNGGPNSCKIVSQTKADSNYNNFSDNKNQFLGQSIVLTLKKHNRHTIHVWWCTPGLRDCGKVTDTIQRFLITPLVVLLFAAWMTDLPSGSTWSEPRGAAPQISLTFHLAWRIKDASHFFPTLLNWAIFATFRKWWEQECIVKHLTTGNQSFFTDCYIDSYKKTWEFDRHSGRTVEPLGWSLCKQSKMVLITAKRFSLCQHQHTRD